MISKRFNFEEMAKRTVGAEWAKRTPEERKEFVNSFRTLLSNSYLGRIENYSGEKVHYLRKSWTVIMPRSGPKSIRENR